jgi:hypothetical protein
MMKNESSTKWGRMQMTDEGKQLYQDYLYQTLNRQEMPKYKVAPSVRTCYPEINNNNNQTSK